ncbi:Hypothetical protein SMAX5B_006833 [Scophthalmus maximus]|uniref:Uncharacterized protein n=1 Tax=Scophthalmus maximus TaxID=52904 RepID=A0A2U9AWN1_SCOMX|nr:Hypothetical protein SMAX5B_006833 [Scophthalmus maximus]
MRLIHVSVKVSHRNVESLARAHGSSHSVDINAPVAATNVNLPVAGASFALFTAVAESLQQVFAICSDPLSKSKISRRCTFESCNINQMCSEESVSEIFTFLFSLSDMSERFFCSHIQKRKCSSSPRLSLSHVMPVYSSNSTVNQLEKRNHIAKIKNTTPKEKPQSRNKKQRKKRIHNAERVNTTPKEKTLRNQRLLESLGGHFTCTMKTSDERLKREGGETDVLGEKGGNGGKWGLSIVAGSEQQRIRGAAEWIDGPCRTYEGMSK